MKPQSLNKSLNMNTINKILKELYSLNFRKREFSDDKCLLQIRILLVSHASNILWLNRKQFFSIFFLLTWKILPLNLKNTNRAFWIVKMLKQKGQVTENQSEIKKRYNPSSLTTPRNAQGSKWQHEHVHQIWGSHMQSTCSAISWPGRSLYTAMLSLGKSCTGMLFVASRWLYSCISADKDDTASVKQLSSIPSTWR